LGFVESFWAIGFVGVHVVGVVGDGAAVVVFAAFADFAEAPLVVVADDALIAFGAFGAFGAFAACGFGAWDFAAVTFGFPVVVGFAARAGAANVSTAATARIEVRRMVPPLKDERKRRTDRPFR
jgi:hypothetical protein